MRPNLLSYLICFLFPLAHAGAESAPLSLSSGGIARLPVIISPQASDGVREIASELSAYLGRVTGATFLVETGDGSRGIVVGTLAEFPDPALSDALAIRDSFNGVEAFAIRTEPERIRLIGARELGVSHAAFRLLEHVGCRWFFPGTAWECVPSLPDLAVALDVTDRPAIPSRRIWWNFGYFDGAQGRCEADYRAWARHNCMAQSQRIWCGHAWQSVIGDNQATFDAHPEYLALVGGERKGPQFCSTNPEVRRIATEWALNQLRRDPTLDMVSMETSDGDGHCECDTCKGAGNISERVFGLANEVARAVAREFPGKMVGLYAYNDHSEPPSFVLEPNVYIQLTAGFTRGQYTFDELLERWPEKSRNLGYYDYYSFWLWDYDMPPGGLGGNMASLRERIPRYARLGATSIDCESGNNWGIHGRGYYIANRLLWNPQADVDALLADFYDKAFGPAADVMKQYYERLNPGNEPLVSEDLLARALRDLEEATKLAGADGKILARLDQLKQYQHYVRLRWDFDRAGDPVQKKALALDVLTHLYRNRYSYMNHWEAIRQLWTDQLAKDLGEPTWAPSDPTPAKPWMVEAPSTSEETAIDFRSDLARFQPAEVNEILFSSDLVSTGLAGTGPIATAQQFQNPIPYALYSKSGEPLTFTLQSGLIVYYRDRAAARYVIKDSAGAVIADERIPQDGAERTLDIPVPGAGVYFLDYQDRAVGWRIQAAPDVPLSIALQRGSHPESMGQLQQVYFYVPKGTRRVQYFWAGGAHKVHYPDGALARTVEETGTFINIPVPEGADGKAWSFTELALGHLWFCNVPNYLAASPEALLVPRDVAERDGLLK